MEYKSLSEALEGIVKEIATSDLTDKDKVRELIDEIEYWEADMNAFRTLADLCLQATSKKEFKEYIYAMDVILGLEEGTMLKDLCNYKPTDKIAGKHLKKAIELNIIRPKKRT